MCTLQVWSPTHTHTHARNHIMLEYLCHLANISALFIFLCLNSRRVLFYVCFDTIRRDGRDFLAMRKRSNKMFCFRKYCLSVGGYSRLDISCQSSEEKTKQTHTHTSIGSIERTNKRMISFLVNKSLKLWLNIMRISALERTKCINLEIICAQFMPFGLSCLDFCFFFELIGSFLCFAVHPTKFSFWWSEEKSKRNDAACLFYPHKTNNRMLSWQNYSWMHANHRKYRKNRARERKKANKFKSRKKKQHEIEWIWCLCAFHTLYDQFVFSNSCKVALNCGRPCVYLILVQSLSNSSSLPLLRFTLNALYAGACHITFLFGSHLRNFLIKHMRLCEWRSYSK